MRNYSTKRTKIQSLCRVAAWTEFNTLLLSSYNHFQSVHLAHEAGLVSDEIYEIQRVGVGFAFSSDVALDLIEIMRVSGMGESLWDVVKLSAEQAKAYCSNTQNRCVARYEAARQINDIADEDSL